MNLGIKVYVQSAGLSNEFDYSWQSNIDQKPPKEILGLINTDSESALYFRSPENDCLALTSLNSTFLQRCDFSGSPIRNAVIWSVEKSHQHKLLYLLSRFLLDKLELEIEIDKYITSTSESKSGFLPEYGALVNLAKCDGFQATSIHADSKDERRLVTKDCLGNRKLYLERLNSMVIKSDVSGALFLLKKYDSLKDFEKNNTKFGVWLGLSSLLDGEEELKSHQKKSMIENERNPQKTKFDPEQILKVGKQAVNWGWEMVKNIFEENKALGNANSTPDDGQNKSNDKANKKSPKINVKG